MIAQKFLKELLGDTYKGNAPIEHYMIEFAKLHVKLALEEASAKFDHYSNKIVILNSYPPDKIK